MFSNVFFFDTVCMNDLYVCTAVLNKTVTYGFHDFSNITDSLQKMFQMLKPVKLELYT